METVLNKTISKHFYSIELLKDDVIYLHIKSEPVVNLEKIKNMTDGILELANNNLYHLIIEMSFSPNAFSDEVRDYLRNHQEENKLKLSQSMITKSITKSIIIGTYYRMVKQQVPTQTFNSVEKAVKWIDSLQI